MINYYYSCPICTRVVNRFRDMRYHLSRCSNTPSTDYDIDDCKSEGMMKTESCDDCGMRFLDTEKHYQHSVCEPDDDEVDEEGGSGYAKHGSYTTYNQRHGPHFQEAREVVLERDNYVCQALGCKISNEEHRERSDLWPPNGGLHVHHIRDSFYFDNAEKADEEDNLITLCENHHRKVESGEISCPRP